MQFLSFCPLFRASFPSFSFYAVRGGGGGDQGARQGAARFGATGRWQIGSKVGGVVTDGGKLYMGVEKWREVLHYNGCSWVCMGDAMRLQSKCVRLNEEAFPLLPNTMAEDKGTINSLLLTLSFEHLPFHDVTVPRLSHTHTL